MSKKSVKKKTTKRAKKTTPKKVWRLSDFFRQQQCADRKATDEHLLDGACADGAAAFKWLRSQEEKGHTVQQICTTARTSKKAALRNWFDSYVGDDLLDTLQDEVYERTEPLNEAINYLDEALGHLTGVNGDYTSKEFKAALKVITAEQARLEKERDSFDEYDLFKNATITVNLDAHYLTLKATLPK